MVFLKDRKRSEDLCSLLGIQSEADVVRCGKLRWLQIRKDAGTWKPLQQ